MFQQLLVNMRAGVVARAFTFRPRAADAQARPAVAAAPAAANGGARLAPGAAPVPAAAPPPEARNLGRNDVCWCGSGKKYKDCHWDRDHAAAAAPAGAAPKAEGAASGGGGGKRRRRKR
jgi:hypothetical protein